MAISDRMWERALALTPFDTTSTADMVVFLASRHFASERQAPNMGSNVPDTTPTAISTHFLDTGLGAIIRTAV
ncbi:hypothetical protein [Desulfovibrio sp. TomC]|uniref:hypothetical protein n=1 Tax=Desulfovibrio sp. TomC TaxID=1562888 RepID=UPI0005747E83|nr:hypothetical protein [Desulfovibrio sp. TomC]KHK03808.1 hypothetical protein NY78_0864 [Desulfovibrio sp. TomC]